MGVVSGIVNGVSVRNELVCFSDKAGPVIGPLMGYVLLGSAWLVMKTEGDLQTIARKFAQESELLSIRIWSHQV